MSLVARHGGPQLFVPTSITITFPLIQLVVMVSVSEQCAKLSASTQARPASRLAMHVGSCSASNMAVSFLRPDAK